MRQQILLFFCFWLVPSLVFGADWYVNCTCEYNGDGMSNDCASSDGQPGAFNGMYSVYYDVPNNSTIHVRGYCTGDDLYIGGKDGWTIIGHDGAVLDVRKEIDDWATESRWQQTSPNIWECTMTSTTSTDVKRLWVDGIEWQRRRWEDALQQNEWAFSNHVLRVYNVQNPASAFNSMMYQGFEGRAITIQNSSNITIRNLELRGGYYGNLLVRPNNQDIANIVIAECKFGLGQAGVSLINGASSAYTGENIHILNNVFNSQLHKNNDYELYSFDGILIKDCFHNVVVKYNSFFDYPHDCVACNMVQPNFDGVYNVEIAYNYMDNSHITYGRAFGTPGAEGKIHDIQFTYNYMRNMKSRVQFLGHNNLFAYNVIDTVNGGYSSHNSIKHHQGILLDTWIYNGVNMVCHDNKVINNTFINTYSEGIRIGSTLTGGNVENNLIANNIFFNTGIGDEENSPYGIVVANSDNVGNNTIISNVFYTQNREVTEVSYHSQTMSVNSFNDISQYGDTIEDNLGLNPLLTEYHISRLSPARNAGTSISGIHDQTYPAKDIDLQYVMDTPDIGADEFHIPPTQSLIKNILNQQ